MPVTGQPTNHRELGLKEQDVMDMYFFMALARTISEKALLLKRQGCGLFTMACDGQEVAGWAPKARLSSPERPSNI